MDDRYNPRCKPAIILLASLEKLAKPKKVEKARQWLVEADEFYQAGQYELAAKRVEQSLSIDPYNAAARKWQIAIAEAIELKRTSPAK